jgi:anti-sigma regulatory factor (Ser/Thr protein kinase)
VSRRLDLTLENRLGAIAEAAAQIERFCASLGVPRRSVRQMNLALDELLTNIVAYAWPQGGTHSVRVALTAGEDALTAEISDDGIPFDPRTAPAPDLTAPIEERRVGGLGVHFAMTLMDRVEYHRVGDENRLTLIKSIQPMESQRD